MQSCLNLALGALGTTSVVIYFLHIQSALFRVLSFCNKFYNKWNLALEQTFEWNKKVTKGSCRLNVRMMELDRQFDELTDVEPGLSSGWKQEQVHMTVDAILVKEVMDCSLE